MLKTIALFRENKRKADALDAIVKHRLMVTHCLSGKFLVGNNHSRGNGKDLVEIIEKVTKGK